MATLTVSGAYGRDYLKGADAVRDWEAGKDFRIRSVMVGGTYVSNRDRDALKAEGIDRVYIRYRADQYVIAVRL